MSKLHRTWLTPWDSEITNFNHHTAVMPPLFASNHELGEVMNCRRKVGIDGLGNGMAPRRHAEHFFPTSNRCLNGRRECFAKPQLSSLFRTLCV